MREVTVVHITKNVYYDSDSLLDLWTNFICILQDKRGCLVLVNSTLGNLKSLALAVASGRAVCLQGPVGSGKTSLVEHLAILTGVWVTVWCNVCIIWNFADRCNAIVYRLGRNAAPHFLKVQLGDQTDSKMLLGSYRCTDVPGEFVWQPGVLTQVSVVTRLVAACAGLQVSIGAEVLPLSLGLRVADMKLLTHLHFFQG